MTEKENVELKYNEDGKDGFALVMWAGITTFAFFVGVADYGVERLDLVPTLLGFGVPLFAWTAFFRKSRLLEALFFGASVVSLIGWIVSIA